MLHKINLSKMEFFHRFDADAEYLHSWSEDAKEVNVVGVNHFKSIRTNTEAFLYAGLGMLMSPAIAVDAAKNNDGLEFLKALGAPFWGVGQMAKSVLDIGIHGSMIAVMALTQKDEK